MGYIYALLVLVLAAAIASVAILSAPPARIATLLRALVLVVSLALGGALALAGRIGIGLTLAGLGVIWFLRNRGVSQMPGGEAQRRSTVRSALLEMELDHDSGDMDGVVLTGAHEGKRLSGMSESQLESLFGECGSDGESRQLLEAYLDRRMPAWREHAQAHKGSGAGGAPRSGAMTKEEAYQILGLAPGAGSQQIREAHRRLMKRVHPDHGGSTFLAARINEAKDYLLN